MKRAVALAALAAPTAALLAAAGVAWYVFSAPTVENLALPDELLAVSSVQGRRLLASSDFKTDYGQLEPHLSPQVRRAFCGPATSAAVINAAVRPQTRVTQTSLFEPAAAAAIKSELAVSLSGLTLDELAGMLRAHGLGVRVVHAEGSDLASFRDAARAALAEPLTFLIVNYDRKALGQVGAGHISPVGAYSPETDRLLVLDVATYKYPYTWVPTTMLWRAMNTTDTDSGRTRGYLLVTAAASVAPPPVAGPARQ